MSGVVTAVGPNAVPVTAAGAGTRVARLTVRLVRRGALLLALATALYAAIDALTFVRTYPDAASRGRLAAFEDDPTVRMLQGVPHAIGTTGGFVVWDIGWLLALVTGVWVLLTVTRLLRGDEEAGRADLVLAAPVRATRVLAAQVLVVVGAVAVVGAGLAVTLAAAGAGTGGSVLFGLGITAFGATCAGIAAVCAQVWPTRGRATAGAAAVFGAAYLLRIVANGADGRARLRWFTPFGWLDALHPYGGDPDWAALAAPVAASVLLTLAAVRLRTARDAGGALIAAADRRRPRTRFLGGPLAFAWRTTAAMTTGWSAGICAYAVLIGAMTTTFTRFVAKDAGTRQMLADIGWDAADAAAGFVGLMGVVLGLLIALYACWRIGAARTEEASGRLEHVLVRAVTRRRWLAGHAALTLAGAALTACASGVAVWAGATATGAHVGLGGALAATCNPLPVVVLAAGLAVLVFGARPRATVAAPVTLTVTAYVAEMVGPALHWPERAMDLSPFHHLAAVPAEPYAPVAGIVLTVLGLLALAAGAVLFERRDLTAD
ncbi:ABC-2 family transporter protein [Actinomadura rubteroloni]|uniref:ABC-2 family transporter protein n=1 Tax=Actinomadura rubteroloni TaxID=1926885 RepID=A0A2P4UET0_9ACTN|nr:hypothetical protein [Actinomadura rubteroloni]POM23563.1 ABC-2 family transporter protein [Actinomadura rubteroloni]